MLRYTSKMKICYVDESGDDGELVSSNVNIQPMMVISGLIVDHEHIHDLTLDFLALKTRFFPKIARSRLHLDRIFRRSKVLSFGKRRFAMTEVSAAMRLELWIVRRICWNGTAFV